MRSEAAAWLKETAGGFPGSRIDEVKARFGLSHYEAVALLRDHILKRRPSRANGRKADPNLCETEDDEHPEAITGRMVAKLQPPETSREADEQRSIREAHKLPVPKRVRVERVEGGFEQAFTWFFFDADRRGSPALFFTSHVSTARREMERFKRLGVKLETTKPR